MFNMFSPESLPLWGRGPAPSVASPLGGPSGSPLGCPTRTGITAEQRCTGPGLRAFPGARDQGRKCSWWFPFPLGVAQAGVRTRDLRVLDSHWSLCSWSPRVTSTAAPQVFQCKSLRRVCSEPLSSGRCKMFILTAVQTQDRGRGQGRGGPGREWGGGPAALTRGQA